MFLQRGSRVLARQLPVIGKPSTTTRVAVARQRPTARWFGESRRLLAVKPVVLADIGEGIVECEVIQWFVEPGATVEEFSPLCEVQSDKASVEITSRFAGTVKKLHYEAGEMARVGRPFIDIDIQDGAKQADLDALTVPGDSNQEPAPAPADAEQRPPPTPQSQSQPEETPLPPPSELVTPSSTGEQTVQEPPKPKGKCAALATPAVRHLSRELKIDISEIDGTGRDGRVLKEDIYKFVKRRDSPATTPPSQPQPSRDVSSASSAQTETVVPLSKTQQQMFKTMTRSLTIPHFLYTDEVNFSQLVELRGRLNRVLGKPSPSPSPFPVSPESSGGVNESQIQPSKLSYLPFIIKAVSLALYQFPMLNARVDVDPASGKPALVHRAQHNIGVAMDTPQGLVVPVIRDVGSLNVLSIAAELTRLQGLAHQGRLTPKDMAGGTITVSNIGNIGGTYLSPVIVEREVAILGIGRMRAVPAFDDQDRVVKRHVCNFSWSADHRVIDGATMARAADVVRSVVEEPDVMVMHLR